MDVITLSVEIGADRRLIIDLPATTPIGQADLVITPHGKNKAQIVNPARESARATLLAAGKLVTDIHAPEDTVPLTLEERQRIGRLAPGARSSEDLINEERGTY